MNKNFKKCELFFLERFALTTNNYVITQKIKFEDNLKKIEVCAKEGA